MPRQSKRLNEISDRFTKQYSQYERGNKDDFMAQMPGGDKESSEGEEVSDSPKKGEGEIKFVSAIDAKPV